MNYISEVSPLILGILLFVGSFLLSYYIIPKIRYVVLYKRLMDHPDERSSHSEKTATLGGVSFFFVLVFSFFILQPFDLFNESHSIISGLTILLFLGLKDDLVVISPLSKIFGQLMAIGIFLTNENLVNSNLHGFLGINEIPFYLSLTISGFLMLIIINAYNLIDGIDGLAAVTGIIIISIFSGIFYFVDEYFFLLLGCSVIASLIAFLRFNLSSRYKIFMGDTGSLIIGFMIAVFTLKFFSLGEESFERLPFVLENAPLIALAILIIPILDTARVFTIRLFNNKSPFSPDRNHIHHVLIDFGFTHKKASLIIGVVNLIIVALVFSLSSSSKRSLVILLIAVFISAICYFILSRISKKNRLSRGVND